MLLYGLTPPKIKTEKVSLIAQRQIERLRNTGIDGLVLYDIQDESSRIDAPRPFPFLPTWAPDVYSEQYLQSLDVPKIIYKSVGKFDRADFRNWLEDANGIVDYAVFVGAPSKDHPSGLSLPEAYQANRELHSNILLGGVAIPERHLSKKDEHIRIFNKIKKGCSYFISQCVYSLDNAKSFLSDYYYYTAENDQELVPIIFTLTPCGCHKTLQFLEWLGIDIPKWLYNDLKYADDILAKSVEMCKDIARELLAFSDSKNIPIGFNIESVAIRKVEIEASLELLKAVRKMQLPYTVTTGVECP